MILNKPYTNKQYAELAIYANENQMKIVDQGEYLETQPQYTEEELVQQKAERVAMLSLTRGDVFIGIYNAKGVTRETLRASISDAEITEIFTESDKELALIAFDEALNFYRGNELVDIVGLQLGISSEQMTEFFETNDYTKLITVEEELV